MSSKRLFVFDLDFTLWNAGGTWCDCTTPPYKRIHGFVSDSSGNKIKLYPDVIEILEILKSKNRLLAIASRTEEPDWAKQILELLNIRQLFDFEEIFPDTKSSHFLNIRKKSGFEYASMVFFDDEFRNIEEVGKMGVTCEWVRNGVNKELAMKYL